MGQYTEHWAEYKRSSNRRTFQLLGFLVVLPLIALLGYALSAVTDWSVHITMTLVLIWLVLFIRLAVRASKVTCPQCAAIYSRGKYLVNCPKCPLRMLQDDPT